MSRRLRAHIWLPLFAYAIGMFMLLPILWLLISAFRPEYDIVSAPYSLPEKLTLGNFTQLLQLPGFVSSVRNSFLVALLATAFTAGVALPTGYLVSRYSFPGRVFFRSLAIIGYLFAPAVLALPYLQILSRVGLIDSLAGIVFTHVAFCLPFSLSLVDLIFRSVPISLEQVAMLDGSGLRVRLWRVLVPVTRFQIGGLMLLVFTISWKEFFFAFLVSSSVGTRTLPVLLAMLYGGEALNWHLLCALSVVIVLPSLFLLFWGKWSEVVPLLGAGTRG